MERVTYAGWNNCIRLENGKIDVVVTTEIGPRVMHCGFVGGQNLFKIFESDRGKTGGGKWRMFGGHRLWHSPEDPIRTYSPDNSPVQYDWDGKALRLTQSVEPETLIEKQMEITLDATKPCVTVKHRLVNKGAWDVEAAAWCLTMLAPGGRAIVPQEPYAAWPDALLPVRPIVLWPYTDMSDPRFAWGRRFIQVRQDLAASTPIKIGLRNTLGWGAYVLGGDVFVKRGDFDPNGSYPDFGSNWEIFTNADILELETLSPLTRIPASGGVIEHKEQWHLLRADIGADEDAITRVLGDVFGPQ
jgi:hypothetical protein